MLSLQARIAAAIVIAVVTAPSIAGAQERSGDCSADSTAGRDTTAAAPVIPKNLAPLLRRGGTRMAGSVESPMVYESAYPKGPLTLRRSSRPMYTQRADTTQTGWVQVAPKSSRWVYVPVPGEQAPRCPEGRR